MFSSDNDWLQPSMANSTFSCVNQPLYSFALLICISKASKKRSLWGMSFFLFMPDVLNWLRNVPNWMNASLRFVGDIFVCYESGTKILSLIWYCELLKSFFVIPMCDFRTNLGYEHRVFLFSKWLRFEKRLWNNKWGLRVIFLCCLFWKRREVC